MNTVNLFYKNKVSIYFCQINHHLIMPLYSSHFFHTKPGGEKSIFAFVIHWWRSTFRQFARARTIEKYDVTISVPRVRPCDDTGQLRYLNNDKSEKAALADAKWGIDESS